jgi:D-glycero-D-manno-heptose 1,7-bisphosphate phosphatase
MSALDQQGITIAAIKSCMHHPEGGPGGDPSLVGKCDCRKPKPGLIDALVGELSLDRTRSWMVGDAYTDVESGRAASLHTALLFAPNRCEFCPMLAAAKGKSPMPAAPDISAPTLDQLAREIILRS